MASEHDEQCESELTKYGYTPCRCDDRRYTCRVCGGETSGFDEHGSLCIECALVKALKEGR